MEEEKTEKKETKEGEVLEARQSPEQRYNTYSYRIDLSKPAANAYDVEELASGPIYVRKWKTFYEPYMPQSIAAFTTLKFDIHLPFNPHGYFPIPDFVVNHEKTHNELADSPYVVKPTGEHDEFLIDTVAKYRHE